MNRDQESGVAREFWAHLEQARQFAQEFDPDVVIAFGADHFHALEKLRPQFTIVLEAAALDEPQFGISSGPIQIPTQQAAGLAADLISGGFDIATGAALELDHGFTLTTRQLFGELGAIPVIPVVINTIAYPLVPVHRVAQFARAVGDHVARTGLRTLFVASGGLSHSPPFPAPVPAPEQFGPERRTAAMEEARHKIRPDWDQAFLSRLRTEQVDWLGELDQDYLDEGGQGANEIRNWVGAVVATGRPARYVGYEAVPSWITGMGVAFG